MNFDRPLRGACHCGRNLYIIQFPQNRDINTTQAARVLFNSHPSHRSTLATPLPSYLRVPLAWYHAVTIPQHADETNSQIHRVYSPAHERHTMRHFCGFCGTPLSFWSEEPRSEADFIQLTLGSLLPEDLGDLEEWPGLLPPSSEALTPASSPDGSADEGDAAMAGAVAGTEKKKKKRKSVTGTGGGDDHGMGVVVGALPWFDALTEGSRLGMLCRAKGGGIDHTGTVRVEWEIAEWCGDEVCDADSPRKRKFEEVEKMEGVQQ